MTWCVGLARPPERRRSLGRRSLTVGSSARIAAFLPHEGPAPSRPRAHGQTLPRSLARGSPKGEGGRPKSAKAGSVGRRPRRLRLRDGRSTMDPSAGGRHRKQKARRRGSRTTAAVSRSVSDAGAKMADEGQRVAGEMMTPHITQSVPGTRSPTGNSFNAADFIALATIGAARMSARRPLLPDVGPSHKASRMGDDFRLSLGRSPRAGGSDTAPRDGKYA